ncbi:nuclear transport factor 2 family protein [Streptomyces sp. NPDC054975]
MDIKNASEIIQKYIDTWNERDGRLRREQIAEVFAEDGSYIDNNLDAPVQGHAGLDEYMAYFHQEFAEYGFSLVAVLNAHNNLALFSWRWGAPGAPAAAASGTDAVVFEDGRISKVYGFLN